MLDKVGQEIYVGSEIVYAVRDGNSSALKFGKVLEVQEKQIKVQGFECNWRTWQIEPQKASYISKMRNVMVVNFGPLPRGIMIQTGK